MYRSPTATRVRRDSFALPASFRGEIRHQRSDHHGGFSWPCSLQPARHHQQHRIAIDQPAAGRNEQRSIAVAIERNAEIRFARLHRGRQATSRCTAPQPSLMFVPVGAALMTSARRQVLSSNAGSDFAHRAIRAIDDDANAGQPLGPAEMRQQQFLIYRFGQSAVVRALTLRDRGIASTSCTCRFRLQEFGNRAVRSRLRPHRSASCHRGEHLDAIVFVRIVRSGNHDAARNSRAVWSAARSAGVGITPASSIVCSRFARCRLSSDRKSMDSRSVCPVR